MNHRNGTAMKVEGLRTEPGLRGCDARRRTPDESPDALYPTLLTPGLSRTPRGISRPGVANHRASSFVGRSIAKPAPKTASRQPAIRAWESLANPRARGA